MESVGNNLKDLVCLQIRSCETITDEGIVLLSEGLSGYGEYRKTVEKVNMHEFKSQSKLQYLNMANDRALTDKAISSISSLLLFNLKDFCFVSLGGTVVRVLQGDERGVAGHVLLEVVDTEEAELLRMLQDLRVLVPLAVKRVQALDYLQ